MVLWQAIAAHTRQLQRLRRSSAIIWGVFVMPEENTDGWNKWHVGRVHVMAVIEMLTADGVAGVEALEMRFRANISPRSVYDQFLGPVKIRMLLLNEAVCK